MREGPEHSEVQFQGKVILLDYYTNGDLNNTSTPLSHAALIRDYILQSSMEQSRVGTVETGNNIHVYLLLGMALECH